jgi:hypothetical protein
VTGGTAGPISSKVGGTPSPEDSPASGGVPAAQVGGSRGDDSDQVEAWVEAAFTPQVVGDETVYNLTAPVS